MKVIPVDIGPGDRAALDTLVASRQGLLIVLLDGRVYLTPLSYEDAKAVVEAWKGGDVGHMELRPPYIQYHRTTMH